MGPEVPRADRRGRGREKEGERRREREENDERVRAYAHVHARLHARTRILTFPPFSHTGTPRTSPPSHPHIDTDTDTDRSARRAARVFPDAGHAAAAAANSCGQSPPPPMRWTARQQRQGAHPCGPATAATTTAAAAAGSLIGLADLDKSDPLQLYGIESIRVAQNSPISPEENGNIFWALLWCLANGCLYLTA